MPKKRTHLTVTDQFCGAGGSSQGVKMANNSVEVAVALNHWKLAIETHSTNFPEAIHDCTDISACDPRRYPSTDILITSPECTNHSLAKGQKRVRETLDLFDKGVLDPAAERSRATMWDVCRFAEFHNYNAIIVENVVDARKWVMFESWLHAMHSLGYSHKCVYHNSMHSHPTPQSRDRMYVVFWKHGNKEPNLNFEPIAYCGRCEKDVYSVQSWKNHKIQFGKYRQQYVYRCPHCANVVEPTYYAAFNIIDWSLKGQRIGDRSRPLATSTMERIQYGLERYANTPIVVTTRYTSGVECRVRSMSDAMPTQPGDMSHGVLTPPYMVQISQTKTGGSRVFSSVNAMMTQTTRQEMMLLNPPFLIRNYGGAFKNKFAPYQTTEAVGTITTRDHHGIVSMPFITELHRTGKAKSMDKPLSTVLAGGNHHGIITGESWESFVKNNTLLDAPERVSIEDCYYRMLTPDEIGRAMAFDDDYVVLGNQRDKVKQYGNAVTPPVMKMLVERVVESLN